MELGWSVSHGVPSELVAEVWYMDAVQWIAVQRFAARTVVQANEKF